MAREAADRQTRDATDRAVAATSRDMGKPQQRDTQRTNRQNQWLLAATARTCGDKERELCWWSDGGSKRPRSEREEQQQGVAIRICGKSKKHAETDIVALISQRSSSRKDKFNSLLSSIMEKHNSGGNPEPSEEEFQAARARMESKNTLKARKR
ncbi:Chaperone protein dnaJ 6 [Platanthera guangdongensis]|uniref:Chaperone protein dnaJ 6 n=1 Tax=Platanthera guangdongensis TaxID=2320717 RepID=A0ABR2LH92_9ASPA